MKTSLKQKLLEILKTYGRLDLQGLESVCKAYPAKFDNATRRLRELMADYPQITTTKNPHGAITAYHWQNSAPGTIVHSRPITPIAQAFLERWKPKQVDKQINTLF